jgi:small conductance mechanosensitive channel
MAPNSSLWNTPITNHSREASRRQELSVAIANTANANAVKQTILDVVNGDGRVEKQPPARVFSSDLSTEKTVLTIQYWARTAEWSETRYDIIDRIKDSLVSSGVELK